MKNANKNFYVSSGTNSLCYVTVIIPNEKNNQKENVGHKVSDKHTTIVSGYKGAGHRQGSLLT